MSEDGQIGNLHSSTRASNGAFQSLIFYLSTFSQIQGCVILIALAAGWYFSASNRRRELQRVQNRRTAGSHGGVSSAKSRQELPGVTVVMPVKGTGEHSAANWRTQLDSTYEGFLEFIFVVESKEDPAFAAALELSRSCQGGPAVKVLEAGQAASCSQKIHNQLAGVNAMSAASEFVLFLDDDIRTHPSTVGEFCRLMTEQPQIFLLTGYPFDIPTAKLLSYCVVEFHLPLLIFFSFGKTPFVWGGCMMLRANDFRENRYSLVDKLRHGGYSDDMTLGAVAAENGRIIVSPPMAVFLHPISSAVTLPQYWNYLQRQICPLLLYNSPANRLVHVFLILVHCWLSWGLVLPALPTAGTLLAATWHLLVQLVGGVTSPRPRGVTLACVHVACAVLALLALRRMAAAVLALCAELSEKRVPGQQPDAVFKWHLMFLGILLGNFLYPFAALRASIVPWVDWSGVRYLRRAGKVFKVSRLDESVQSQGSRKISLGARRGILSYLNHKVGPSCPTKSVLSASSTNQKPSNSVARRKLK